MKRPLLARLLKPFGVIEDKEAATALLMFCASFLAMAAYTAIKPATRSKFIENLGPTDLPFVQLVVGIIIGFVMAGYSWLVARLPHRWSLPIAQGGITVLLLIFWVLFQRDYVWVSVGFYLVGLILGILLLSQFWSLANIVFDSRQAKRLFGFIGGGSSLGGILGSLIAERGAKQFGTSNLILFSVAIMTLCIVVVITVIRREPIAEGLHTATATTEKGVSGREALRLLRESPLLRVIALVITFAAIAAAIIDQQLNMAAAEAKGLQGADGITVYLARVQLWTSIFGLVIQVFITSRIHRAFGIGLALLLLPISISGAAVFMVVNATLWAPSIARVIDQSLRYSIDKTTREILFMPLGQEIKFTAKPFVDVTVDRFARGFAAVAILFLIKPWGLELNWQKLSYMVLATTAVWIIMSQKARKAYDAALRTSIADCTIMPAEASAAGADMAMIEELIQELASPDEKRVVYAIDLLESIGKRHLVTPLLLHHESPVVKARALSLIRMLQPSISARWLPAIEVMLKDENPEVRSAAVGALASINNQRASDLARPLLEDKDPRIALTAAMVLAGSDREDDTALGDAVLSGLVMDMRESAAPVRKDAAIAIRHVQIPHFRRLLIPLLNDPNAEVAEEAMRTTRALCGNDFLFVVTLISLLANRRHKKSARELIVGHGDPVLPILRHFLYDPEEALWVRRHIPATIARIPCQLSMDILIDALGDSDGFLRFHAISALEKIHRLQPELQLQPGPVEEQIIKESGKHLELRAFQRLLFDHPDFKEPNLLSQALDEKMRRGIDRIYRMLGLIYSWKEIAIARHALQHGDRHARANTIEYLDSTVTPALRKKLIPALEDVPGPSFPFAAKEGRPIWEAALLHLINGEDPVLAAAAVNFIHQQEIMICTSDLEDVLADPGDRHKYVLEAASWVLSNVRTPAGQRSASWHEPLPLVEIADKLRRLPLFESVSVDELFRICEAGQQVRYDSGHVLCREAHIPEAVQFLLSGSVAIEKLEMETKTLEAPAAVGFREVLEDHAMAGTVTTVEKSVCVNLRNEDLLTMLGDNSTLVRGLFQMLSRESGQERQLVVRGNPSEQPISYSTNGLKPIEKGLVLKAIPLFAEISSEEIIHLAAIANEMPLTAGTQLFGEGEPPALYAIISGEITIESDKNGESISAGPTDVVGVFETLAGTHFECRARITRNGIALRADREDLLDLLSQRSPMLRQVFSALFRTGGTSRMVQVV